MPVVAHGHWRLHHAAITHTDLEGRGRRTQWGTGLSVDGNSGCDRLLNGSLMAFWETGVALYKECDATAYRGPLLWQDEHSTRGA